MTDTTERTRTAGDGAGDERPPAAPPTARPAPPSAPEMPASAGRRVRGYVLFIILAALLLMTCVAVVNALVDPYGILGTGRFPTATTSDRSVKVDLIQKLKQAPQLIVLGSSRSMRYDPEYLQQKTGLRTFNAGVNIIGGGADVWAMTNFLHDRFPQAHPKYLWLVDVETFTTTVKESLTAEPRLARYLDKTSGTAGRAGSALTALGDDLKSLLSWATTRDSLRILSHQSTATAKEQAFRKQFRPNGGIAAKVMSPAERQHQTAESLARYTLLYQTAYHNLDPQAMRYVEQTLALMNQSGSAPLIVLTPMSSIVQQKLGPLGWYDRHRQVVDFFTKLSSKYQFTFADMTSVSTWGGSPTEFFDGIHPSYPNIHKLIDFLVQNYGGAL
jgi:hypothetical protein